LDFSKLRTGEIVASLGGVALFVFMFFDWFATDIDVPAAGQSAPGFDDVSHGVVAKADQPTVDGWDALGGDVTGFIVFLAAILAITIGVLALTNRRRGIGGAPWGGPTTAFGVLAFDIIVWRMFAIPPPSDELKAGVFLGLLAAAAIVAGGYMILREGGLDLLASGGSSRSSGSSRTTTTKKAAAKRKPKAKAKPAAKRRATSSRRSAR
jgi:hypothetical protein